MMNHFKPRLFSKPRAQRGVASIEFAILIVPLLLMLLGVFEYGRAIYQYNTLAKATRNAARFLSTVAPGSHLTEARNMVVCGRTSSCGTDKLVPSLTTSMVTICDAVSCAGTHANQTTGSGTVNLATISINDASLPDNQKFRFNSIFNFELGGWNIGAPNITFGPIRTTVRQAS